MVRGRGKGDAYTSSSSFYTNCFRARYDSAEIPAETGNVTNQAKAMERKVRIDTWEESWIKETATTAPTLTIFFNVLNISKFLKLLGMIEMNLTNSVWKNQTNRWF